MTGAYAGILNGGSSVAPFGIRILEVPGNEELNMFTETGIGERVITEEAAQLLVYMMAEVVNDGTGARARLVRPVRPTSTPSAALTS
jgi:penicillin-binding protein 1A